MSGHSKWSTIKHKKGVLDVRRGRLFTKLAREIAVAAREGGSDPDGNVRLRLAIERAKQANMPYDNIARAVNRGSGTGDDSAALVSVVYEGYGPGGAAILLEALTDNRNRIVSEVRGVFTRSGGSLGESGCVSWLFESRGVVAVDIVSTEMAEELALAAIDAGAEDFLIEDGILEIYSSPSTLGNIRQTIQNCGAAVSSAELSMVPKSTVSLGEREAGQTLKLLESLEELDDVQRVYTNADFPNTVLEQYRVEA